MTIPTLLITDPKWSQFPYVVCNDDYTDCVPDDWVNQRIECDSNEPIGADENGVIYPDLSFDDVQAEMLSEFKADNTQIDDYWPGHGLLLVNDNEYYEYWNNGEAEYIGEFGSLTDCLDHLTDTQTRGNPDMISNKTHKTVNIITNLVLSGDGIQLIEQEHGTYKYNVSCAAFDALCNNNDILAQLMVV